MDAPNVNMLTEQQLKELLDIRTQITALQVKYDAIIKSAPIGTAPAPTAPQPPAAAASVPQAAPVAPAAAPTPAQPPAPLAPQPLTAAPSPAHVAPATAPAGLTAKPVSPSPASAAPVSVQPSPASAPAAAGTNPFSTEKKDDEPKKIATPKEITANVRQMLVTILTEAGKPLPFNAIYSKLEATGIELPAAKPMLVVRKLLHDETLFEVAKGGMFRIKSDTEVIPVAPATPAAPQMAAAQQPVAPVALSLTPAAPQSVAPVSPSPTPAAASGGVSLRPGDGTPVQQAPKSNSSFSSRLDAILNQ